jgi:uncharacterized membrane protein YozB (DUF420 family)
MSNGKDSINTMITILAIAITLIIQGIINAHSNPTQLVIVTIISGSLVFLMCYGWRILILLRNK